MLHKYEITLLRSSLPDIAEPSFNIHAQSLTDVIGKLARKHRLEAPAYWDEPLYDKEIELTFKRKNGSVACLIRW